jgi:hypothetical protein
MEIHHGRRLPTFQRLLLRFAAATLVGFALLIYTVRALGSSQPPPAVLSRLHLTECVLPCWMGITPGATAMRDAAQRLSTINLGGPMSEANDGRSMWGTFEVNGSLVYVQIQATDDALVRQITLISALVDGVRFGDVVSDLGVPTCGKFAHSLVLYSGTTAEALIIGTSGQGERGIMAPLNNINIRLRFDDYDRCLAVSN